MPIIGKLHAADAPGWPSHDAAANRLAVVLRAAGYKCSVVNNRFRTSVSLAIYDPREDRAPIVSVEIGVPPFLGEADLEIGLMDTVRPSEQSITVALAAIFRRLADPAHRIKWSQEVQRRAERLAESQARAAADQARVRDAVTGLPDDVLSKLAAGDDGTIRRLTDVLYPQAVLHLDFQQALSMIGTIGVDEAKAELTRRAPK